MRIGSRRWLTTLSSQGCKTLEKREKREKWVNSKINEK